jgi:exopolyphosphatase/guanosine-5'-triphosphate,3'-diphosphate pyrophosphatase
VAELAHALFAAMKDAHGLDARYELILYVAALLHEIGAFVSSSEVHKHSMYLIQHSDLFGLSAHDVLLVALVARYHRRASPKPTHAGYGTLDRERRVAVSKLAALLRIAIALDASRSQRVRDLQCSRDGQRLIIAVPYVDDLSVEQLALRQSGSLFEEIYGMQVLLRTSGGVELRSPGA